MKIKEYASLQLHEVDWLVSILGENVVLLRAPENTPIERVNDAAKTIETALGHDLIDLVPAYHSIAIFSALPPAQISQRLRSATPVYFGRSRRSKVQIIPICYELGLDLKEISRHSGLSIEEVISIHLAGSYQSIFVGFTPGFIYADGLDPALSCPRKVNPRTSIKKGSVGIGGDQTGIYSLDSPGGWNIIGRTPISLFEFQRNPPLMVEVGTSFSFQRISQAQFESWVS